MAITAATRAYARPVQPAAQPPNADRTRNRTPGRSRALPSHVNTATAYTASPPTTNVCRAAGFRAGDAAIASSVSAVRPRDSLRAKPSVSQPTNANAAGPHTSATPNQVYFERVSHSTAYAIGMA